MIPEFIGRLPVVVTLSALEEEALVRILTEPKNALVKQYQKLLSYDDAALIFEEDALSAIAERAIERNIGARGLRAVMEGLLTKIMYDVPSDRTIEKVIITEKCVLGEEEPRITRSENRAKADSCENAGIDEPASAS